MGRPEKVNESDQLFKRIVEMVELHYLLEPFNVYTYLRNDGLVGFDDRDFTGNRGEYAITVISYFLQR
ncbi:hypothetical protein [Rufibacter hautae]|uniref:Uncharacterized protein n=1 Tax=Rufibacter hautae TaxID=2595005 RepID=A0A5B6TFF5_9BACT|nr:hypothetical protein [Rufibacter hautae]KAA3437952.1 hypothetical protein FOA19_11770 [Rufibacter hautae]